MGEFALEVEEGFAGGGVGGEEVEGAAEEVVEAFDGGLGSGGGFEEFDEVGGAEDFGPGGLEAEAEVGDGDFAEGVEVGFFGGQPEEVGGVEEVEFAGEGAGGAAGALGGGADEAVFAGAPVHDEAGLGEEGFADEDGAGFFDGRDWRGGWRGDSAEWGAAGKILGCGGKGWGSGLCILACKGGAGGLGGKLTKMDEKTKAPTIDLQAFDPAALKSRLSDLRRYL